MTFTNTQTKLGQAITTNDSGDYAVRTIIEGDQTLGNLAVGGTLGVTGLTSLDGGLGADVDAKGNYLLNEQTTTNMMSKGTVYRFTTGDVITVTDSAEIQNIFTNGGFISSEIYPLSDGENDGAAIAAKITGGAGWLFNIQGESAGFVALRFYREAATTDGSWVTSVSVPIATQSKVTVCYNDSTPTVAPSFYLNGVLLTVATSQDPVGALGSDVGQNLFFGDKATSNVAFDGEIGEVMLGNFAPTAAQIKDFSGNIPFKWQYGSQTEMVVNGQDWTGATGATKPNNWFDVAPGLYSVVNDGGAHTTALKHEVNAVPSANPAFVQQIVTVIGKRYKFSLDFKNIDATQGRVFIGTTSGGGQYLQADYTDVAWTEHSLEFTATSTDFFINIYTIAGTAGLHAYYDNVRLVAIGAVALYDQTSISETYWYDKANGNDGAVTGASVLNPHGHAVDSSGAVPGILFPATQVASTDVNKLDDYQEGTFTPTIYYQNATDQANVSYTTQLGWYTKIGNVVNATVYLSWSISSTPPANDNIGIAAMPYAAKNSTNYSAIGACTITGSASLPTTGYRVTSQVNSQVLIIKDGEGTNNLGDQVGTGAHVMSFTITYSV